MSVSTRSSHIPIVDLIYDAGCPNVDSARALLRSALAEVGVPAVWREWDRASPSTPPLLRGFGSPTILVDGIAVGGDEEAATPTDGASCCRVYFHEGQLRSIPAIGDVIFAVSGPGRFT